VKTYIEWFAGWLPAALGYFAWLVPPSLRPPWDVFGIVTCYTISVILHEIAHFVAAKVLGLNPWCVNIGRGAVVFDHELKSFRLILRAFPYSGMVYPYGPTNPYHIGRWRVFLMVLAGPLANAIVLSISLSIVYISVSAGYDAWGLTHIPVQMCIASVFALLSSLLPFQTRIDGVKVRSDGLQMLSLLIGRRRAAPSERNAITRTLSPSWRWVVNNLGHTTLLHSCRSQLESAKLSRDEHLELLDVFATAVLMYGAHEHLSEADRYSEELFKAKPTELTVKGTRGSILIEKGELAAGREMLAEVMAHDPSKFDQAIAASFLALADLKENRLPEASRWLRTARELDPNCPAIDRIESLFPRAKAS
jgi:hypothetical protein